MVNLGILGFYYKSGKFLGYFKNPIVLQGPPRNFPFSWVFKHLFYLFSLTFNLPFCFLVLSNHHLILSFFLSIQTSIKPLSLSMLCTVHTIVLLVTSRSRPSPRTFLVVAGCENYVEAVSILLHNALFRRSSPLCCEFFVW